MGKGGMGTNEFTRRKRMVKRRNGFYKRRRLNEGRVKKFVKIPNLLEGSARINFK
jgi:hypothetical protein